MSVPRRPTAAALLFAAAALPLLASPAPGAPGDDPAPAPLTLCLAAAADGSAVYPLSEVPSNHRALTVVYRLREDEKPKTLTQVWTAVDVGDAAPAGTEVSRGTLETKGTKSGRLSFTLPRDLPIGRYRLDVEADGKAWAQLEVPVVAAAEVKALGKPADLLPLAVGTTWSHTLVLVPGPIVKNVTMPGTQKGADGRLRGPASYTVAALDGAGALIEIRRGDVLVNEEWWRLDAEGLSVTKQRQGKEESAFDPPVPLIRLPLASTSEWRYEAKDKSFARSYRMWGPLPVVGPKGPTPGWVVLSTQATPRGKITAERHFAPGIGVVREVQVESVGERLLTRLEIAIAPAK